MKTPRKHLSSYIPQRDAKKKNSYISLPSFYGGLLKKTKK